MVHYLVIRIQNPGNNVREKKREEDYFFTSIYQFSLAVNITIQGGERANLTGLAEKLKEVMGRVQPIRE